MSAAPHLLPRLIAHARASELFPAPGRALVAVSGGPDSVALLDLLAAAAGELELALVVGHVDHGIAADSTAVARSVAALAARYDLPFRSQRFDLGRDATETGARGARYAALRVMQREVAARYLVTAHHADDQAETVLYRLLRGSGPAGLAGIPATGRDGLVRPVLPFARAELAAWLAARRAAGASLPTSADAANADERHDRSWRRRRVFPLLAERWPDVRAPLERAARHAARERRAWATLVRTLPELEFRRTAHAIEVARPPVARYDNVLSEALLRAVAREAGCVLGPRRAARLALFVARGASGGVMPLGDGWQAELAFDRLRLTHADWAASPAPSPVTVDREAGRASFGGWDLSWRMEPAGAPSRVAFVAWVAPRAGVVRGVQPGDRILPLGGVGRRKVRRLLMEARVPSRERNRYPVLARDGAVLWIPGICRSAVGVPVVGEPAMRVEARAARDR